METILLMTLPMLGGAYIGVSISYVDPSAWQRIFSSIGCALALGLSAHVVVACIIHKPWRRKK